MGENPTREDSAMQDNRTITHEDLKTLRRLSRERALAAPKIRAQTFKSGKEYKRKAKYPTNYNQ